MPKINLLAPFVADLIAAGEVVERPGSVLKELLENSIDAGAKRISAEFSNGGMTYISVKDDGVGMSPEDAGIAFLRHATSKITDERGLEAIGTLGFRGEALAAISAVSRIELSTRERGALEGTYIKLEAGEIIEMKRSGCPEGTSIIVRDLFFNTPARLKFIKKDRSEAAGMICFARNAALSRPDISIRLQRDGREEFLSPGDGLSRSAIYSLLGRDLSSMLLPALADGDKNIRVSGFVCSPRAARGNRSAQYFFVNGRPVRSKNLQTALELAYKNSLPASRFPAAVLYIELSLSAVDVNVHPTKAEIRFSDERLVFDCVYSAAKTALLREASPAAAAVSDLSARIKAAATSPEKADTAADAPRDSLFERKSAAAVRGRAASAPASRLHLFTPSPHEQTMFKTPEADYAPSRTTRLAAPPPQVTDHPSVLESVTSAPEALAQPQGEPDSEDGLSSELRLVGEAMSVYIILECGEELIFIDKHAAHERIIFDKLREADSVVLSQMLMTPIIFSPGSAEAELLLENQQHLSVLGFDLSDFGDSSIILRALPEGLDPADALSALDSIIETYSDGAGASENDAPLRSLACKMAIKAGNSSEPDELLRLAGSVLRGEISYCPHGRPLSFAIKRKELDKRFLRIK